MGRCDPYVIEENCPPVPYANRNNCQDVDGNLSCNYECETGVYSESNKKCESKLLYINTYCYIKQTSSLQYKYVHIFEFVLL